MISVITVTYNASTYITETIASIVQQRDCVFELILVDGGSSDDTVNIVKQTIEKFNNPLCHETIISEKDKGIYDAMNKGAKCASGDYIIYMNGGDIFYSNNVLYQFEMFRLSYPDYDAYYGNTLMVFYEGEGILHEGEGSKQNPIMPFIHQSVIVKRDLLLEHPFNLQYKIVADLEFFYWMRTQNKSFIHGDFIVCRYDAKEGLSENNPLMIELERDRILGIDKKPHYWLRKLKLRCTKGVIQPIKDYAPRWLLDYYFRRKKKHIIWV